MNEEPDDRWKAPEAPLLDNTESIPAIVMVITVITLMLALGFPFYGEALLGDTPLPALLKAQAPVILLMAWGVAMSFMGVCYLDIRRFTGRYPAIDSLAAWRAFTAMVARNMWLALVQIGVLLVLFTAGVMAILHDGLTGVALVGVTLGIFTLSSRRFQVLEQSLRQYPVDAHFEAVYQRVCHRWLHDALPRF
ncbi:hypothetical protein [Isoalcanivorax indicus]|uniref:hypothetical protein n=1 Tax=Isoalcanivorax indicus TaxID=2202653 RepID=UPI000DB94B61|nr:hypothetical protein [Isoalcanivorax indicus]